AVDFSDKDSATISQAISIGEKDTVYCLIHILESPGALLIGDRISDKESKEDLDRLNAYAATLRLQDYTKVEVELASGNRAKKIADLAKKFDAELLVMGGHGHRGIKDLIFGETINEVRHLLNIPVLA